MNSYHDKKTTSKEKDARPALDRFQSDTAGKWYGKEFTEGGDKKPQR